MIVNQHFERLLKRHVDAEIAANADGSFTVTVPDVPTGKGWNLTKVAVAFVVPAGYPLAAPDCFWAEPGLALEHGGPPQNTGQNPGPNSPNGWLWFSWHPSTWNANSSNMETYLNVIRRRFADAR